MFSFISQLLKFGDNLTRMFEGIKLPQGQGEKTGVSGEGVAALKQNTDVVRQCTQVLAELVHQLGGILNVLPAAAEGGKGGPGGAGGQGGAGAKRSPAVGGAESGGLEAFAAGLGGAVTAVQGVVGTIQGVMSQVQGFVEALDPGLIQQFNYALKSLQATIGYAFEPIFDMMIDTFRDVAGIIMPLMEQLRPVIQELTQNAIANLIPRVEMLASLFEALLPLFEVFMTIQEALDAIMRPIIVLFRLFFEMIGFYLKLLMVVFQPVLDGLKLFTTLMDGLQEILQVVTIVYKSLFETLVTFIKSLFGGSTIQDTIKQLRDIIKEVIRNFLLFIAYLAKFFGANDFLGNLIKNLKPKTGQEAAGPTSIKTIESITKEMAEAAAQAAGGAGEEKKFDLGDVVKELEAIQSGQQQASGKMLEVLEKTLTFLRNVGTAIDHLKNLPHEAAEAIKDIVPGWLRR